MGVYVAGAEHVHKTGILKTKNEMLTTTKYVKDLVSRGELIQRMTMSMRLPMIK